MFRSSLRMGAIATLGLFAILSLALSGCGSKPDDGWSKGRTGPKVVASFGPYYCFAANVAGDDAEVRVMMTNSGPHDFQGTDKDARLLSRADLFFINGLGLDSDKAESLKRGSGNQNLKIIDLGSKIPHDKLLEGHHDHDAHDAKDEKDHDHDHDHGKDDPHVWLSPEYAIILVQGIRDELKSADPAHAANYDRRAEEYIAKLRKLQEEGIAMLKDKKDRRLVTFHESMAYFAKTFDLNIVDVVEKTPGTEPSDKQLKELISVCADKDHPVRLITVEPQYSTSNSGAQLIKELQNKNVPDPVLVEFDTLETAVPEQLNPDWYETKMRANLNALKEKMK